MKIAEASSEIVPYAKTGGLGDVVGTLPLYLEKAKQEVSMFIPLYKSVITSDFDIKLMDVTLDIPIGDAVHTGYLWKGVHPDSKDITIETHFTERSLATIQTTRNVLYFFQGP